MELAPRFHGFPLGSIPPCGVRTFLPGGEQKPLIGTRWSSSGLDKCLHGSEFAGRLDFNQHARNPDCSDGLAGKHDYSDVLLEVQSPVR